MSAVSDQLTHSDTRRSVGLSDQSDQSAPPVPDRLTKKQRAVPLPVTSRAGSSDRSSFLSPLEISVRSSDSSCDSHRSSASGGSRDCAFNQPGLRVTPAARPISSGAAVDMSSGGADDVWVLSPSHLGPPLPPRQPLRRSHSLTHRSPLIPHPPAVVEPPPPLPPTRAAVVRRTLTRSAPQLEAYQVVPMTSWPLQDRSTANRPRSRANVVPLSHWPLPDLSGRLAMDSLIRGTSSNNANEYVEAPVSERTNSRTHQKSVTTENRQPSTHLNLTSPGGTETTSLSTGETSAVVTLDVEGTSRPKTHTGRGLLKKLTLCCMRSRRKSSNEEEGGCRSRMICPRCGRCVCRECRSKAVKCLNDEQLKRAADVVSCMCCVKPIFYHCLKDDSGEEDCSEKPCSCGSGPHCCRRWTIMALLAPCLPCLCLYPALHCALRKPDLPPSRVECVCDTSPNNNRVTNQSACTKRLLSNSCVN